MHARARHGMVTLALGSVACRPPAGPTEVTPEVEVEVVEPPRSLETPALPWVPLASTIPWPAGALAIALPPGEPAAWLLPPFEPGHHHPLDRLSEVAHGERIALARSGELLLATEREQGLLGMVALPPEIVWIGVGGGDRILAADAHGRVFAAATITEALAHGLRPTGAVLDEASSWDAAGERVLAVVGSAVMVSEDGGRSFRATEPARGVTMTTAVVRADGVMVALSQAERATAWVSDDGGRSWRHSSWHFQALWREDAWIIGWTEDQTGVLASDGRSWAGGLERGAALHGYRTWGSDFFAGSLEPGTGRWPTPTDPPAPPPPARPLRGRPRADSGEHGVLDGTLGGIGHLGDATCEAGLVCLHGSVGAAPPPSRLDGRSFGDARCEVETAPCPRSSWRAPHVGVFDHATGRLHLGRLPRWCEAVEVAAARGLGLVSCRHGDGASLMVVEPDGTVHAELEVSHAEPDVGYVMMAEDGTLLVPEIPTCEQWARAWVRRPVAPGAPEAWTSLVLPGARTWRPVGRGYALAVADHPDGGGRLADLWLAGPGLEPAPVLEGIPVLVGVTDVRVDDGRVSLHADGWRVVRRDASLTEVELPSRDRVVDGLTMVRAHPWLGCGRDTHAIIP
jgi:hypothetical protein